MLISMITGSENFQGGSSRFMVSWMDSANRQVPLQSLIYRGRQEVGLLSAEIQAPRLHGAPVIVSAGVGMKAEMVGRWATATYVVAEAARFEVHALRKAAGETVRSQGRALLRARADASLLRLCMPTIRAPRSQYQIVYVEGRFDLLSDPAAYGGIMELQTIAGELAPPVVVYERPVTSSTGQRVAVPRVRTRRALDLED